MRHKNPDFSLTPTAQLYSMRTLDITATAKVLGQNG